MEDSKHAAVHSAISHDTLDPVLNAWLLPLRYHWQRPHAHHPSSTGVHYPTHPPQHRHIPLRNQALSLHWIPLSELMDLDSMLSVPTAHRPSHGYSSEAARIQAIQERYGHLRPDLVDAFVKYDRYYRALPPGEGLQAETVFASSPSRLVTTSTGLIYPVEHPVVDVLKTPSLSLYLDTLRTQARQRALDRLGVSLETWNSKLKNPLVAREMGSTYDEMVKMFSHTQHQQQQQQPRARM